MRKYIVLTGFLMLTLGIILVTATLALAQSKNEFTIRLSDPSKRGKLKAHINSGSIVVKGTSRQDILVRYEDMGREADENDEESNGLRRLPGGTLNLEATENNNNVVVKSDSWKNKVNLDIEVPAGFDLQIHTYNNGDLSIQGVQGVLELTNFNGAIHAAGVSGSVVANTYNGDIKIAFDKVSEGTPMSFSTFSGNIDLTFPSAMKASLKMKSEQGEIFTGFDVDLKNTEPVRKEDEKAGTLKLIVEEWVLANINGGGPEFTMKNYNGNIYIRKK